MKSLRYLAASILALSIMLLVAAAAYGQAEYDRIDVYYNDELLLLQNGPLLENGTALLEFRPIFEQLGFQVFWNEQHRTITGTKQGLHITLTIGETIALVNGEPVQLTAAPKTVQGRTVVPLRFIGEAAGCYVRWESGSKPTIKLYRIAPERAVTDTNYIYMSGKVPNDVRWVRFGLSKDGIGYGYEYIRPDNGRVEYNLYLSDGAGRYDIQIAYSLLSNKDTQLYEFFAETAVDNKGHSGLHVEADSTDNSRLALYGELTDDVVGIAVRVAHNENGLWKWVFVPHEAGAVRHDLYLSFGPGLYTLSMYTSIEPLHEAEEVTLLKTVTARNDDPRERLLVPSELVESEHPDIVALASRLTAGLISDAAKSKAIHDWVATNIKYDAATFLAGEDRVDSALETLQGRLADCDGYARLNAALHRAAGIQAKIVVGVLINPDSGETWENTATDTPNHAWNEVLIGGRWVVQDPTLNAGYIDKRSSRFVSHLTHDYYDPTPQRFARDHLAIEMDYVYE